MRLFVHSGLVVAAACCLTAQTSEVATEVTTKDAPVSFQSGVNLVPVTVVVRDKSGHAVGTLGRDDFELFDNGKPRMISRFTVEKLNGDISVSATGATREAPNPSGPALAQTSPGGDGIPNRFVAYVFDDLHMSDAELVRLREAAKRRIDSATDPLQRIAIFTTSNAVMQEFTSDRDKLHAALAALSSSHNTAAKGSDSACPPMTPYLGYQIYYKNDNQALSVAGNDAAVCANLFTPHGIEWDTAVRMAQAAARDAVLLGDKNTESSVDALRNIVSRMASLPGQRTLVLVSPGFLLNEDKTLEETTLMERALKANVIISALDARGLYTGPQGGSASQANIATKDYRPGPLNGSPLMPIRNMFATRESMAQTDVMAILASGTGGVFYENSNDYDDGLARTSATPEYLYVLGFSPIDMKLDGNFHSLKVTLKAGTGLTVEARKGYFAPTHATDPAEQAKQQIEEEFFARDEIHDLPAVLQTQYFKSGNGDVRLSATAEVDVKKLAFHRDGDRNRNNITVVTGVFDSDGNYVAGAQKIVEMRLLDETLAKRLGSGIAVKTGFDVHSGKYVVRMVVRDSEGQTMAAQSRVVEIP